MFTSITWLKDKICRQMKAGLAWVVNADECCFCLIYWSKRVTGNTFIRAFISLTASEQPLWMRCIVFHLFMSSGWFKGKICCTVACLYRFSFHGRHGAPAIFDFTYKQIAKINLYCAVNFFLVFCMELVSIQTCFDKKCKMVFGCEANF